MLPFRFHRWSSAAVWVAILVGFSAGLLHHAPLFRDLVRFVELLEATAIIVLTLAIARRYFLNFKADPTSARLLPLHVLRLGIGTALLTVHGSISIIVLIGHPYVWWTTPILLPTFTILLAGLWDMVSWLPNRTAPPSNAERRATDPQHHNRRRDDVA